MKQNYSKIFSFLKPGLLLAVFLFFGISAQSQTIINVDPGEISYCQGKTLDFQFTVRNGGGGSVGFDTESVYTLQIGYTTRSGNNLIFTTLDEFNFTNKQGPAKVAFEQQLIQHSINIRADLPVRSDYQLLISSTNPNVPISIESLSADKFQILANSNIQYQESDIGQNSWIGHVYDGTNQNRTFTQNFTTYIGGYPESLSFDQNFGGNNTLFNLGNGACADQVQTETFSVRYRMLSSLKGLYYANIGSDDGTRLNVDGNLIYDDWNNHAYRNQDIVLNLSGNSTLTLEYFENSGGNRVSFGTPIKIIENKLSTNISQTINSSNNPRVISGDSFNDLPSGISTSGTGYQWVYSNSINGATTTIQGATQATYTPNINVAPFNTAGTYYIYRIASLIGNNRGQNNYSTSLKSNPATIVVEEQILITGQPQNTISCSKDQITLNVTAQGQGLSYQWQRNDGGNSNNFFSISNGTDFSSTTTPMLKINAATWMNNFRFRVVITNSNGVSKTSSAALLTVNQSPQGINAQPTNKVVCVGNNIFFQTYTSDDTRQWQVSNDNGSNWTSLTNNQYYSGVNSERLTITSALASFNNNLYRIAVSNQSCTVYSNAAKLQVDLDPITVQPKDVTANFGDNAIIEAGVTGNNLSFQWQTFSSNWYDIGNDENYGGTNTKRLELKTVGYFPVDGSRYRLLVTNSNGCVSISSTAVLNVNQNNCSNSPTISLNAPSVICAGNVNISGILTGVAPWTISGTINGAAFELNFNDQTFNFPINLRETTQINITKISDATRCTNTAPNTSITVNVINSIENNVIIGDQQSCGTLQPKTLTGENLGAGYIYGWEASTTGPDSGYIAAPGKNDEANYTPGVTTATTWYRRKVNVQNCNSNISNSVKITIDQEILDNNISYFNGTSGQVKGTVAENGILNLKAPESAVFTYVNFASYGTPKIENGNFKIDNSCHAVNSRAISESLIFGENEVEIAASNNIFTDPCVGTYKSLSILATYSEAFCQGTEGGVVTGSEIKGTSVSYKWQISTQGPSGTFADAPGVNNLKNYNLETLVQDIWVKRIVNSGSCSSNSPVLYIPVISENTWTGTANSDWNNTANWSCNLLPTLTTDVRIPEDLVSNNYPVVSSGANALAKSLFIENNASIKVTNNWLRIAGTLKNSGSLNAEFGSISFEGNSAQIIPIAAFKNNRIENLRISNTSGVTSEAIIEITGILKVELGNFNTGNLVTLISNKNKTALIDGSGSGEVVGSIKMQRYLDKAFGYKYFSTPFKNSVVGDFSPYMDFKDPSSNFPNFYRYNENRNININNVVRDATGWEDYSTISNSLNVAEGYALNFGTNTSAQTIELSGVVNNGVIPTLTLKNNHRDYTKGFHLVGNPYPSPIDWLASSGWTKTNIDNGIYFFTASDTSQYTGTYTAYVNDISTGDPLASNVSPNIIPSMQGFFIKVSDSDSKDLVVGNFGMNNNVRINDFDQQFYKSAINNTKPIIRLEAGFRKSATKDPLVLYFSPYSSRNFEKELDAYKLMNTDPYVPSFYTITEDKKDLAINAIQPPIGNDYSKIPLGIKAEIAGEMSIHLSSIENLASDFNIYLIDLDKKKVQNLRENDTYTFMMSAGIINTRFELMFSEEIMTSRAIAFDEPFDIKIEDGEVNVQLNLKDQEKGILRASTIAGQMLQIKEGYGKEKVVFEGITSNGVYIINLQVGDAFYAKKIIINR